MKILDEINQKALTELSELDEFFGREPRAPLASMKTYLEREFENQNKILQGSTRDVLENIEQSATLICGSLENGFETLYEINSNGFENIQSELENINNTISFGFGDLGYKIDMLKATTEIGFVKTIEQLNLANTKLESVIQLLNIPDSQKDRKYHLEQGLDFYKKSNISYDFIEFSKENFIKALDIERTDYLSLYYLGIISSYIPKAEFLNLEEAQEYFEKAALFGEADINHAKVSLGKYSSSFDFGLNPRSIASDALMHSARIYYKFGFYQKSKEASEKSYRINPENVTNIFDLARYNAVLGDSENALINLDLAISKNRYLSIKALKDKDLATKRYVHDYLKNLSDNTFDMVEENDGKLKAEIKLDSVYYTTYQEFLKLKHKKTYLSSLEALELIGINVNN